MSPSIRTCTAWEEAHDRPVYTLGGRCPVCDAPTRPSGPAPFNPNDPYGAYRRALKRRQEG
ncbi:MAG: nucleolar RNA-binding Nop10p family protein [Halobacteriota archaeon]